MHLSNRTRGFVAAVAATAIAAVPLAAYGGTNAAAGSLPQAPDDKPLATVPSIADPDVGRQAVPEDEYAMALGCYELANVASGEPLGRDGDGYGAAAAPFHFEPTQLGQYLLLDPEGQLLAAEKGASEQAEDVVEQLEFHAPVGRDTHLTRTVDDDVPAPLAQHTIEGNTPDVDTHTGAVVPGVAGPSADWRARHNLDGTITFTLPAAAGRALAVVDGTPQLVEAGPAGDAAKFTLRSTDEAACT